jgi:hypothetical protein
MFGLDGQIFTDQRYRSIADKDVSMVIVRRRDDTPAFDQYTHTYLLRLISFLTDLR